MHNTKTVNYRDTLTVKKHRRHDFKRNTHIINAINTKNLEIPIQLFNASRVSNAVLDSGSNLSIINTNEIPQDAIYRMKKCETRIVGPSQEKLQAIGELFEEKNSRLTRS
jgi:hypothetical protein